MYGKAEKLPILPMATIEQAVCWIAFHHPPRKKSHEQLADYPEIFFWQEYEGSNFRGPKGYVYEEFRELLCSLASGEITALGRRHEKTGNNWPDNEPTPTSDKKEAIPAGAWDIFALDLNDESLPYGGYLFKEIEISFDQLSEAFPPNSPVDPRGENGKINNVTSLQKPKRGAPAKWPREQWLEVLAILALRGKIRLNESQESIAANLIAELPEVGGNQPALNTAIKEWVRPIIKAAKKTGEIK